MHNSCKFLEVVHISRFQQNSSFQYFNVYKLIMAGCFFFSFFIFTNLILYMYVYVVCVTVNLNPYSYTIHTIWPYCLFSGQKVLSQNILVDIRLYVNIYAFKLYVRLKLQTNEVNLSIWHLELLFDGGCGCGDGDGGIVRCSLHYVTHY